MINGVLFPPWAHTALCRTALPGTSSAFGSMCISIGFVTGFPPYGGMMKIRGIMMKIRGTTALFRP